MKNVFLFTSLALLACWGSKAQPGKYPARYGMYAQFSHPGHMDGIFNSRIWGQSGKQYTLGLSLRQPLSSRWTLSAGIGLNYKAYDVMGEQLHDPSHPAYNPSDELGWNCLPIRQTVLYAYHTQLGVEIPVQMQYHIVKDRFFVSSGLEVNAGLYRQYKAAHMAYDRTVTAIDKTQAINTYQFMLPLGFGVNIPAGRHQLSIEPGIKVLLAEYRSADFCPGMYTLKTSLFF